jgi:hypothetical protein
VENQRTVHIEGATFIVNSFSRGDAKETQAQLLRRAILRNAEAELKAGFSKPEPGLFFCRGP